MTRRDGRQRASSTTRMRAGWLRRQATGPEQRLWSALQGKQLAGLRFRCQHPIEPYIVDFYCPAARLAIELDGVSHDDRARYDRQRTRWLQQQGIHVLRFTNEDVLTNLDGVLECIARVVTSKTS